MSRRVFRRFEAIASAMPANDAQSFEAIIAVQELQKAKTTRFHRVSDTLYLSLLEAESAADDVLRRVVEVGKRGELIWERRGERRAVATGFGHPGSDRRLPDVSSMASQTPLWAV